MLNNKSVVVTKVRAVRHAKGRIQMERQSEGKRRFLPLVFAPNII